MKLESLVIADQLRRGSSGSVFSADMPPEFDAKTMTLVLTADPKVAETSMDITEIWKGELIVKDVPVEEAKAGLRLPDVPRE